MRDWSDQKVVIVGAARQGLALTRYLVQHGARVVLNDRLPAENLASARQALADLISADMPIEWVCGGHPLDLLDDADLLCLSGGVPLTLPLVGEARARGIPLSNDSLIFLQIAPCKVIGITGSAGKTTTTSLVGYMAEQAVDHSASPSRYRRVWIGGNIGTPLIASVDEMEVDDLVVMELSSFQLEIMDRSPRVAAVLNITPNHLDRHRTMAAYRSAKARILEFQVPGDIVVLGRDDPGAWSLVSEARGQVFSFGLSPLPVDKMGTFIWDEMIYMRSDVQPGVKTSTGQLRSAPNLKDISLAARQDIALRGEHNLLNVMAACTIAVAVGLPVEAIWAGIRGFTGIPHRLEFIRSWGGADWYNDSIATAPERAIAAIRSFDEPLIILAGGRDKDLLWDDFASLVIRRVEHLILFGEAAELIFKAVTSIGDGSLKITCCDGLKEAVWAASRIVRPGDVVLLAPGGTSFDEFKDFEERGECFAQWVRELE